MTYRFIGTDQCSELEYWPSGLKMETARFSKMLASIYEPTQHHKPEHHTHSQENLKSYMKILNRHRLKIACLTQGVPFLGEKIPCLQRSLADPQ